MHDMLVKLYDIPPEAPPAPSGIVIRRTLACERRRVVCWVAERFGDGWAGECETATSRVPASCYIALSGGIPTGFACYDAACRGFFGPAGIQEGHRGKGIGRALLHACLASMRAEGYAYAVIGGVAADCEGFYMKTAGAVRIEGSDPGIYAGLVRRSGGG